MAGDVAIWISLGEAARRTGYKVDTLRRWWATGDFVPIIGRGRGARVDERLLADWMDAKLREARREQDLVRGLTGRRGPARAAALRPFRLDGSA